ncbi:hypothetical protein U1Q18_033875 [Sarracenia purpurea var. burkii]
MLVKETEKNKEKENRPGSKHGERGSQLRNRVKVSEDPERRQPVAGSHHPDQSRRNRAKRRFRPKPGREAPIKAPPNREGEAMAMIDTPGGRWGKTSTAGDPHQRHFFLGSLSLKLYRV